MNSRSFHNFLTCPRPPSTDHLGQISYSFYLTNAIILFILIHTLWGCVRLGILPAIYLTVILAVTEIFNRLSEHPTMLLGRRVTTPRTTLKHKDLPITAQPRG